MAAYLIGHITVRDPDLWQVYTAGVKESLIPFEANIVFRGQRAGVLAGEHARGEGRPDRRAQVALGVEAVVLAVHAVAVEHVVLRLLHQRWDQALAAGDVVGLENLLGTDEAVGRLRRGMHTLGENGLPVLVSFHPAYLLRSPLEKRKSWQDLRLALQVSGAGQPRRPFT